MLRCNILANWISAKIEVTCSNFFSPKHDPTMVIFSLYSRPEKDKIINHPQFTTKLTEFKLKLLPPPREADETIIFVRNLPDSLFLFWDTEFPHNLAEACNDFTTKLKQIDPNITNIHLIQHRTSTTLDAPKAMRVFFSTPDQAKAFLNQDTPINHTIIRKNTKTMNVHITPKYCTTCRQHTHRKGDSACSKTPVCPTCLSTQHTEPQATCKKICATHGDAGHTSASDLCPTNRQFVRQERAKLNNKPNPTQIDNLISNTPEDLQPLHRTIIQTAHQVNQASQRTLSFQEALKKGIPGTQPQSQPRPQPHTPAQPNPTHPSRVIASAFFFASLEENVKPGSFQATYIANLQANQFPVVKCVTPSLQVLHRAHHPSSRQQHPKLLLQHH